MNRSVFPSKTEQNRSENGTTERNGLARGKGIGTSFRSVSRSVPTDDRSVLKETKAC